MCDLDNNTPTTENPVTPSTPETPQPAPAGQPAPQPAEEPAWTPPTPQLTLEPDPVAPSIQFPQPPRAPEPPAPEPQPAPPQQSGQEQPPVQYATYNYNFNAPPEPNGYQPPNFTAQSYQARPQQPKYTTPPPGYQQKSRLAAGLLAFMLGGLGIHNFYLGFNTRGTIQLILCLAVGLFTCGLGSIAAFIWGFIEAVGLLSSNNPRFDGNGVILRD